MKFKLSVLYNNMSYYLKNGILRNKVSKKIIFFMNYKDVIILNKCNNKYFKELIGYHQVMGYLNLLITIVNSLIKEMNKLNHNSNKQSINKVISLIFFNLKNSQFNHFIINDLL